MDERARLVTILERARERGARGAEIFRVRRDVLEQTGSRARPTLREERAYTVRVFLDGGRTGTGEGIEADEALAVALAAAPNAPPDPHAGPAERMPVRNTGLGIDDPRHGTLSDADRVEVLQLAERSLAQGGLRPRSLRYRQVRARRAWMSSRGVEAEEGATTYELTAEVIAGEWDVPHRIASRHFSDVASLPFGADLRRRAEPLARAAALPDAPLPVVLEPRVMAELVRGFAPAFAATSRSFALALLGKRLASPHLHVTDDAGLHGGLQTCGFDERGVPPIAVALLKEGVVHGLFHDPESARAVGLRPTGHVRDGAIRATNLVVRPGSRTRNVILAELRDYLAPDRAPAVDLAGGRLVGLVPVVVVRGGERVGTTRLSVDVPLAKVLGAVRELAADQERSAEVDASTVVLDPGALG
ncbi:MAG: metallopeptidase TldD-related protein [Myxococcota bacterium]